MKTNNIIKFGNITIKDNNTEKKQEKIHLIFYFKSENEVEILEYNKDIYEYLKLIPSEKESISFIEKSQKTKFETIKKEIKERFAKKTKEEKNKLKEGLSLYENLRNNTKKNKKYEIYNKTFLFGGKEVLIRQEQEYSNFVTAKIFKNNSNHYKNCIINSFSFFALMENKFLKNKYSQLFWVVNGVIKLFSKMYNFNYLDYIYEVAVIKNKNYYSYCLRCVEKELIKIDNADNIIEKIKYFLTSK